MPYPLRSASAKQAHEEWRYTLAAFALLLLLAAQLVHVARVYSANWDEAHHLYDGYNIWTHRDYRLNAEVPPLVKLIAALPLLPMHPRLPAPTEKTQALQAFRGGRAFVFGNGGDRILFPARMACMVFTLVLATLLYAAAREMFGEPAALFALALFVFDPNVLAHGTLVSTDLGSACLIFASVYAFYRYGKVPGSGRLVLTMVAAGLAMCAKFTGILVWPTLVLLAGAEALEARSWTVLGRRLGACAAVFAGALCIVWAMYGFRYAPAPGELSLSPALAPYLLSLPSKANAAELGFLARLHALPEAYLWGLAYTKHTEWEYTSYFFGRMYRHGPALYFPVAFLIKSTLPLLMLLLLLPMTWRRRRDPHTGPGLSGSSSFSLRELYFCLVPVFFYFAVVTTSHMDIGGRHLMPIYPFLYVLAGATLMHMWWGGLVWRVAAAALLLWQVVTTVRVAPAYMVYGNEAWGGPTQVHRYLSDANTDWGQQLKAVKQYLDANGIKQCWFGYFPDGAVEPADYGVPCKRLPTGSSLWWFDLPMKVPPVLDGTVLLSDSDLEGIESGDGPLNWFNPFRGVRPVATIQGGVYVYEGRFAVPLMAALVKVRETGELANAEQAGAALAAAQEAVALAPDSAITQLNLADRLAAAAEWREAASHYRQARTLARTVRPELQPEDLLPKSEAGVQLAESHF